MLNRLRTHPLWPVRRAAWALLVVGGVPTLVGGLPVAACLYEMSTGRGSGWGSGLGVLAAGLAAVFLLIPGVIHVVFGVLVWRARASAVRGATVYTWVLLGLLGWGIWRDIHWVIFGKVGLSVMGLSLSIKVGGMLGMAGLLWCLRAAGRCLRTQARHGFDVILPNAQALQTGYPLTTPPPARRP